LIERLAECDIIFPDVRDNQVVPVNRFWSRPHLVCEVEEAGAVLGIVSGLVFACLASNFALAPIWSSRR
jgi:hypothetical protein